MSWNLRDGYVYAYSQLILFLRKPPTHTHIHTHPALRTMQNVLIYNIGNCVVTS